MRIAIHFGYASCVKVGKLEIAESSLRTFCQKWQITEFAVFGSVLRDDFGPESDVDVLVTFEETARWRLADLAAMRQELAAIVGRHVDLVERAAVTENPNWLTRHEILESARVLDVA